MQMCLARFLGASKVCTESRTHPGAKDGSVRTLRTRWDRVAGRGGCEGISKASIIRSDRDLSANLFQFFEIEGIQQVGP